MKHRKLRIAWSVAWGIAAVLLVALWVRSYWVSDRWEGNSIRNGILQMPEMFFVTSSSGRIRCFTAPNLIRGATAEQWHHFTSPSTLYVDEDARIYQLLGYNLRRNYGTRLNVPNWFLALVSATCGIVPWIAWSTRFGVRSLLIATTFIAVVMGLAGVGDGLKI